jgi:hypothetical protein
MALGLATTGATLAADPIEVDLSGLLEGDGQAELELDLLDDEADAEADVDAAATLDVDADTVLDADSVLDADADVTADAKATFRGSTRARQLADAAAAVDTDADADVAGDTDLGNTRVTGFMALDVCARLALLGKTGPCDEDPSGPSAGDAVVDGDATLRADAALDAALSDGDGSIGPDDGDLAAAAAADACLRLAVLGDAGSCAAESAPGGGPSDADDNAIEALAKLATAVDAAATDEGTAATAALDACASLAVFGDASTCGLTSAPDDGDTAPGTDDPGTSPDDDGAGTGPGRDHGP